MQPIKPIFVDSIPSTNETLKALARDGAPEGTMMVARLQTHGYGRLSRAFFSPPDTGLYMSLLLRPDFAAIHTPLLTHAAAVAVAEAVTEVAGVTASIKWVNDIYVNEKKAAGILVESALGKDGALAYAVLGIGVNLFPPECGFPPNIPATAIFPAEKRGEYLSLRDALIRAILSRFAAIYDSMPSKDFLADYRRLSFLTGKDVLVYDAITDREKSGKGTPAHVTGIDDEGALTVRFEDGREVALSSGEVTLKV